MTARFAPPAASGDATARPVSLGLASLRKFATPPMASKTARCDLCGSDIRNRHEHVFEPRERRLSCACASCAILFPSSPGGRHRRVVTQAEPLATTFGADDWELLGVPVRLAFFAPSDVHDKLLAVYPSARGTVEARLPLQIWHTLVEAHPELSAIEHDVEGLLVDAVKNPPSMYRASIDVCFGFIGALRAPDGARFVGLEGSGAIDAFIAAIRGGAHG